MSQIAQKKLLKQKPIRQTVSLVKGHIPAADHSFLQPALYVCSRIDSFFRQGTHIGHQVQDPLFLQGKDIAHRICHIHTPCLLLTDLYLCAVQIIQHSICPGHVCFRILPVQAVYRNGIRPIHHRFQQSEPDVIADRINGGPPKDRAPSVGKEGNLIDFYIPDI